MKHTRIVPNIAREWAWKGHTTENQNETSVENSGATYKRRINKYIRIHLSATTIFKKNEI